ncbi:hypothetical protein DPMN_088971 [Dreissena polymorpha]|uniref:Uncharacterized protein n=1 Tax=Dreissena polymorpha TaxID=45954 RepID=A0A9D4KVW8_DREPO|nr:hypothetical protein DPMN_088971 [Dreissena polymorpha]
MFGSKVHVRNDWNKDYITTKTCRLILEFVCDYINMCTCYQLLDSNSNRPSDHAITNIANITPNIHASKIRYT